MIKLEGKGIAPIKVMEISDFFSHTDALRMYVHENFETNQITVETQPTNEIRKI